MISGVVVIASRDTRDLIAEVEVALKGKALQISLMVPMLLIGRLNVVVEGAVSALQANVSVWMATMELIAGSLNVPTIATIMEDVSVFAKVPANTMALL